MLSATFAALLTPAESAYALTKKEKQACYGDWAGRGTGEASDGKNYNEANFKKNKCSVAKKGSCSIARYSDGSSIYCQRSDNKWDNRSGKWNATDGGFSAAPEGDGAPDTGNPGGETEECADDCYSGTNPVAGDDCGGVETAFIKCSATNSGDTEDNGIWALLLIALNIMTAGVGILAVGGIVYGSILYTTAEDKADQVKKATDIITNVVIGLVLFALMWAGLNFIVPGGVFQ